MFFEPKSKPKPKKIFFDQSTLKLIIPSDIQDTIKRYRQIGNNISEDGGAIMGKLNPRDNEIRITHILKCKNKSENKYNLEIDPECLQSLISQIWKESKGQITYLGSWHTHPEKKPTPSIVDFMTFTGNYHNSNFDQDLLIYMILGTENKHWIKSFSGFRPKKIAKIIWSDNRNS